jgi:hypothetical protein
VITDGLNPLNFLMLVGVVLGVGGAGLLSGFALLLKRGDVAKLIAALALGAVDLYVAVVLIAGWASRDRVLALGQEKHICEVDCHLAYSVMGAETRGTHCTVTVKVRFDETTISPRRGMGPLMPNSRYVALVDDRGRRFEASTDGLRRQLVPGESFTTDLVFDVAPDARDLRLVLRNDDPETRLVIGHENSFLHGKTTFRLSS